MKILKSILYFAVSSVISWGCKKDVKQNDVSKATLYRNSTLDPITDFFQTARTPAAGTLELTSFTTLAMQTAPCTSTQYHGGYDRGTGKRICLGLTEVRILGKPRMVYQEMPCDDCVNPAVDFSHLFGQTITLAADQATLSSTFEHDFYVPTKVTFSNMAFAEGMHIGAGSTIHWNTDTENPKGDVVYMTFDPGSYENADVQSGGTPIAVGIPFDNSTGTYTFNANDFAQFPQGAHIKVYVCRFNFEIFTDTELNQDFFNLAGSTVMNNFILDK